MVPERRTTSLERTELRSDEKDASCFDERLEGILRRQDAPAVFDMATVAYVAHPQFIMQQMGIFGGRVRAVKVPVERAIDIDTLFDFELAEFLINRRGHRA